MSRLLRPKLLAPIAILLAAVLLAWLVHATREEIAPRPPERSPEGVRPFWQIERDEIQRGLDLCRGNVQEVARRMEISAATLYRKIEKYGLVK